MSNSRYAAPVLFQKRFYTTIFIDRLLMQMKFPAFHFVSVTILLVFVLIVSLSFGPINISLTKVFDILYRSVFDSSQVSVNEQVVVVDLRLSRAILAIIVGAGLAITGAVYQGLFRNPLADPGLIGVSSGAACGAVSVIVVGANWLPWFTQLAGAYSISVGAFLGALLATFAVYKISLNRGNTSTSTLLLSGIAIGAICQAIMGMLTYAADDNQLRSLTFWSMGSLAGISWRELGVVLPVILCASLVLIKTGKSLDALLMGESVSFHLGIRVERMKRIIILLTALIVGCAVSLAGIIGFVGLVVPHLVRMVWGPKHQFLLPMSALLGALILLIADTFARTIFSPAELPIGLVTTLIGGPFFLLLLLNNTRSVAR